MLIQLGSSLWSSASRLSRFGAKAGFFHQVRIDARVVSVGNIQAGGAGKTPLVAQIANEGAQKGLRVWILTRGYRGEREKRGGILSPDRSGESALEWGDEAILLHDLCPNAWIGVGQNRVEQYRRLLMAVGGPPDIVVLDDGFQNHQIVKDVEVVALTSAQPNQIFFRDSWSALHAADLLVWTKGDVLPEFSQWQTQKPWTQVQFKLTQAVSTEPLWLFTGIASSETARQLALQSGYVIVKHTAMQDHFRYDRQTIENYLSQAEGLGLGVALTGKDWVKWKSLGVSPDQVIVLEPEIDWVQGRENWERVVWAI